MFAGKSWKVAFIRRALLGVRLGLVRQRLCVSLPSSPAADTNKCITLPSSSSSSSPSSSSSSSSTSSPPSASSRHSSTRSSHHQLPLLRLPISFYFSPHLFLQQLATDLQRRQMLLFADAVTQRMPEICRQRRRRSGLMIIPPLHPPRRSCNRDLLSPSSPTSRACVQAKSSQRSTGR